MWDEAEECDANLVLLRVSLNIYSGKRRCKLEEAHSEQFSILCSILAGCGFATS